MSAPLNGSECHTVGRCRSDDNEKLEQSFVSVINLIPGWGWEGRSVMMNAGTTSTTFGRTFASTCALEAFSGERICYFRDARSRIRRIIGNQGVMLASFIVG